MALIDQNVATAVDGVRELFSLGDCFCDEYSIVGMLNSLPTQEIIHCKDCKHWNLQVGNVKGDGLGSCDFHNVNLVTGEGFCYWADRRGDSDGTD